MARKRFAEGGGESVEWLMLQRIWGYEEKIFDEKRTKQTYQMMRDILRHASPLWRDQRSTNARLLDPRNHNLMKRRRAGVVHTNLGQPHDKMEWLSKVVGIVQRMGEPRKNGRRPLQKSSKKRREQGDTGLEQK